MMSVKFRNDRLGLTMGWCQWTTYRKPGTASRMVVWPMTSWPQNIWGLISRKPYKIQGWCQWGTDTKPPTVGLMVTWPMTPCDPKSRNIGTFVDQ